MTAPRIPDDLGKLVDQLVAKGATDDEIHTVMAAHGAQPIAAPSVPSPQAGKTPAQVRGFNFAKDNATRDAQGDQITSLGPTGAALSGATFNFAPKIEGAIDAGTTALANKVGGVGNAPSFSDLYAKNVGARQAADQQYAKANPKTALAAGLVGGLVPTIATGGAGFGGGIAKTALTSGLYGAGYGAGGAAPGSEGMGALKGGAVGLAGGALLGGAGKLAAPYVTAGLDKAGDVASRTIVPALESRAPSGAAALQRLINMTGGRGQAASTLIADTKAGGVDPAAAASELEANAPALAGQQIIPADVGGRVNQQRAGQLSRSGGEAGGKVQRLLTGRSEGAAAGADAELAGALPAAPNGVEVASTRQSLDTEKQALGDQFEAWHKANPGDFNDPAIDAVMGRPALQPLLARVQRSRQNAGESLPLRQVTPPPKGVDPADWDNMLANAKAQGMALPQGTGTPQLVPDLEALHLMERTLAQAKRGAFEGATENPMTRQDAIDLAPVVKLFRQKIAPEGSDADKLFKAYQSNRKSAEAIDVGLNLFKDNSAEAVTNAEQAIRAMSPAEVQHMQMGAKQALRDNVGSAQVPNTDATGNIAAKAVPSSGNDQRLLRLAFPDDASFAKAVRQSQGWRSQEATHAVAIGGSQTAERGAIDAQANPIPSLSSLHSPVQATGRIARSLVGGRQDANAAQMRNYLADLHTNAGPLATAGTFRNAITATADQAKTPGALALAKLTAALLANQSFNRP